MGNFKQDLHYGFRMLLERPGFAVVVIVTLALGVGFNSAIFSVINSVLLHPLPYDAPDRLAQVWTMTDKDQLREGAVSPADFLDWQKQADSFESMAVYNVWPRIAMTGSGEPVVLEGAVVSANFFSVLGVSPMFGRAFTPQDEQPGSQPVVLLGYELWQRQFGGDDAILGKTLALDGNSYEVVGVMPADYKHPEPFSSDKAEIFRPLIFNDRSGDVFSRRNRGFNFLRVIARLKPGISVEQAQSEMTTIAGHLQKSYPETNINRSANLIPLHEQVTGKISLALWILQGAVGLVLLIACVNITNLMLARAAAREREVAIRAALGASWWRLARQFLTESLLLAAIGGALGLLVALWAVDLLISISPRSIPRLNEIRLDGTVIAFNFIITLLTAIVFGLVPAFQARKIKLYELLKEGGQGVTSGPRRQRSRGLLVISEIALALILLVGSLLMLRSFIELQNVNPGFDAQNTLTMYVSLPRSYREPRQIAAFHERALNQIESLPEVEAAGVTSSLPLTGFNNITLNFAVEDRPAADPSQMAVARFRSVSPHYFHAMGIPLVKGRLFNDSDIADAPPVVIINETTARRHFAGEDPIGKRVTLTGFAGPAPREVVGVVGDIRHEALTDEAKEEVYVPAQQQAWANVFLVVRATSDAMSVVSTVKSAIWASDDQVAISKIRPMEDVQADTILQPRFNTLLFAAFAGVALILAVVGIYGVISYTVTLHTREIGIRMALGASSRQILKLILGQGLLLATAGVIAGMAGAFGLTRLITSLLYGVSATDTVAFVVAAAVLIAVALIACYIPAQRATKVDPMTALRYE